MQVEKCLHNLLDSSIHQTRIKSLIPLVDAIVKTKVLRLSQLGLEFPHSCIAGIALFLQNFSRNDVNLLMPASRYQGQYFLVKVARSVTTYWVFHQNHHYI